MKISSALKKRFCDDKAIPIKIFQDPYFTDRLRLYGYEEDWVDFVEMIEKDFKTDQDYFEYYNKVKESFIQFVKGIPSYEKLNGQWDKESFKPYQIERPKNGIYKKTNLDKKMLSVDLSKANFNALRHFDKELVGNVKTYEEFIKKFTETEHIQTSKYIRQVVFGALNPDRQRKIEKHMIGKFIEPLLKELLGTEEMEKELRKNANDETNILLTYLDDELVFNVTSFSDEKILEVMLKAEKISMTLDIPISTEVFTLKTFERILEKQEETIISNTDFYLKEFVLGKNTGDTELVGIDPVSYPLVYKCYKGLPITESDKVFLYEKKYLTKILDNLTFRLVDKYNSDIESEEKSEIEE